MFVDSLLVKISCVVSLKLGRNKLFLTEGIVEFYGKSVNIGRSEELELIN